ncbi:MAG: SDR family NAD(P)-dependent oxidoreductase [Ilumatobacteraceae bacterium]
MIVNVGSIAGLVGIPYSGIYAASKHALEALTEAMAFELGHLGIRVGIIEPGQYATELGANADTAATMRPDSDAFRRWEEFRTASRRLVDGEPADPQQVADAVYEMATTSSGPPAIPWRDRAGNPAWSFVRTRSPSGAGAGAGWGP